MKKVLSFAFLAVVLIMTACSGAAGADAVAEKINKNEQLSQADYTVMIDYLDKAMDEAQKIIKDANGDTEKLKNSEDKMQKEFPHAELFIKTLSSAKDIDDANQKKLKDLFAKIMTISFQL